MGCKVPLLFKFSSFFNQISVTESFAERKKGGRDIHVASSRVVYFFVLDGPLSLRLILEVSCPAKKKIEINEAGSAKKIFRRGSSDKNRKLFQRVSSDIDLSCL